MSAIQHSFDTSTFCQYRRELHRYLMKRLRRPQDVDDLAQEVYLRLCRVDDDRCVHKPLAYLYGIASHVLADFRMEVKHESERVICDSEMADQFADEPSCVLADDLADRLNLQQQIDKALARLPPTHRAVLLAHKRDGLSYEEVAEKLGLSVHTVAKYITIGKAHIRTMEWER